MSSEDVRELVDRALDQVVVGDVDLDEAETIFDGAKDRLDELRVLREGR